MLTKLRTTVLVAGLGLFAVSAQAQDVTTKSLTDNVFDKAVELVEIELEKRIEQVFENLTDALERQVDDQQSDDAAANEEETVDEQSIDTLARLSL